MPTPAQRAKARRISRLLLGNAMTLQKAYHDVAKIIAEPEEGPCQGCGACKRPTL